MKYGNVVSGEFESRPNRFAAYVTIDGKCERVHVKNTGRCKELLVPGAKVMLETADNPCRKTKYDLVCVYNEKLGWVNIDSQSPNKVAAEWLSQQNYSLIKPEYTYGKSRFDFYMEKNGKRYIMEVKGCTLEIEGVGYFPDAPTERGVKHLYELAVASEQGYECSVAFVIQMNGIAKVRPNIAAHPEFGAALAYAKNAGVGIWFLRCFVSEKEIFVVSAESASCLDDRYV